MENITEGKLKEILAKAKTIFNQVDSIGRELRKPDTLNMEYYHITLDKLSGCYTYLMPLYKKLEALKTNAELGKYMDLKNSFVPNDIEKKFVNTVAEKEASYQVRYLRMARNILEGYVKATENNINTCKKHMGGNEKEREVTV